MTKVIPGFTGNYTIDTLGNVYNNIFLESLLEINPYSSSETSRKTYTQVSGNR